MKANKAINRAFNEIEEILEQAQHTIIYDDFQEVLTKLYEKAYLAGVDKAITSYNEERKRTLYQQGYDDGYGDGQVFNEK